MWRHSGRAESLGGWSLDLPSISKTNYLSVIWDQKEGVMPLIFALFLLETTMIRGCGVLTITSRTGGRDS